MNKNLTKWRVISGVLRAYWALDYLDVEELEGIDFDQARTVLVSMLSDIIEGHSHLRESNDEQAAGAKRD